MDILLQIGGRVNHIYMDWRCLSVQLRQRPMYLPLYSFQGSVQRTVASVFRGKSVAERRDRQGHKDPYIQVGTSP